MVNVAPMQRGTHDGTHDGTRAHMAPVLTNQQVWKCVRGTHPWQLELAREGKVDGACYENGSSHT